MLGKPKYKVDDIVKFNTDNTELIGQVFIVDAYGTFFQDEEVSYDIMVDDSPYGGACLFKHIRESMLSKGDD